MTRTYGTGLAGLILVVGAANRDNFARLMTQDQIAEAQKLAEAWKPQ